MTLSSEGNYYSRIPVTTYKFMLHMHFSIITYIISVLEVSGLLLAYEEGIIIFFILNPLENRPYKPYQRNLTNDQAWNTRSNTPRKEDFATL